MRGNRAGEDGYHVGRAFGFELSSYFVMFVHVRSPDARGAIVEQRRAVLPIPSKFQHAVTACRYQMDAVPSERRPTFHACMQKLA